MALSTAFVVAVPVVRVRNAGASIEDVRVSYRCSTRRVIPTAKRSSGKARERRRGDGRRSSRISELIYREITPIVEDGFASAFDGEGEGGPVVVTVEGVTCTADLRAARVRLSITGDEEQKKTVFRWLKDARKSMRYELAQCVRMKYVPELQFGESEEPSAQRTISILERLAEERKLKQVVAEQMPQPQPFDEDGAILDDGADTIGPSYMNDGDPVIIDVTEDDDDELTRLMYRKVQESL